MGPLAVIGANLLMVLWIAGGFVLLLLLVREERKEEPPEARVPVAPPFEETPILSLLEGTLPVSPEAGSDVIWERRPPSGAGRREAA